MGSEHFGRYDWAAQIVSGCTVLDAGCGTGYGLSILAAGGAEVTGVDIDPDAVAEARNHAECGGEAVQGDLHALEFADDSFDAAVCFETIEHLASPEQGMAEMRRVIRPGGLLVVSSPNPDVYPSGNEHHVRELRPGELVTLVEDRFGRTRVFIQHAWLASVIEAAPDQEWPPDVRMRRSVPPNPTETTFSIVVGSDRELPEPAPIVSLGETFEVRWWEDRLAEAGREPDRAVVTQLRAEKAKADAAERRFAAADGRAEEVEAKLSAKLLEAARSQGEAEEREARIRERLRDTGEALTDANQELAQVPILKHRLAELYDRNAALQGHLDTVLDSRSWRVTSFLRRLSATLKLQP